MKKKITNILNKRIYVNNYQDMSSYGALMMGLLGMNIKKNFKDDENKKPLGQNRINIYFDPISLI